MVRGCGSRNGSLTAPDLSRVMAIVLLADDRVHDASRKPVKPSMIGRWRPLVGRVDQFSAGVIPT